MFIFTGEYKSLLHRYGTHVVRLKSLTLRGKNVYVYRNMAAPSDLCVGLVA